MLKTIGVQKSSLKWLYSKILRCPGVCEPQKGHFQNGRLHFCDVNPGSSEHRAFLCLVSKEAYWSSFSCECHPVLQALDNPLKQAPPTAYWNRLSGEWQKVRTGLGKKLHVQPRWGRVRSGAVKKGKHGHVLAQMSEAGCTWWVLMEPLIKKKKKDEIATMIFHHLPGSLNQRCFCRFFSTTLSSQHLWAAVTKFSGCSKKNLQPLSLFSSLTLL